MEKRKLSFWQIWNMSFGFLGIQMGFALQNSNVSRIFQTLGANIDDIPILWVAAPLTGLIIQPIIGYFSDRTWTKLGRRKPYFLAGAIFASAALFIMPNSPLLWVAAGMLWIMDASINVSMEPFRAFVGDNLPEKQRTMGFAMQSFFIGIGAYFASKLPLIFTHLGVQNTAPLGIIPDSVKYSFYFGGIVFLLAVLWTVIRSKEYSPEELAAFEQHKDATFVKEEHSVAWFASNAKSHLTKGILFLLISILFSFTIYYYDLKKDLYVLSLGLIGLGGLAMLVSGLMQKANHTKNGFVTIMNDFQFMPKIMKQLAWVQFFSWFALFSMWIYTTLAVTQHIYGTTDTTSNAYNTGANQVGEMFANYNLIAALASFLLPVLAKYTSRKFTHFAALVCGGLGLISIYFIKEPTAFTMEWLPMIGVGIAWASILSIPYAMLSGSLPSDKMGYYMGVFNFFIVIPQLVAASILGFLVSKFFNSEPIYALLIGGASMILAGIIALTINDNSKIIIND
ncbi:maltose/moltooligosaccharide transporter [Flavobacterium fryxellicola]|uniref:MFS transporter n=1 Tax=Flavobacterium fryxellicola TaxID=249352 RepID=A0A167U246_9FLAO|nr:MFS transporter [Flavobacterium fryxellicola]OAB25182.1 MFS transporter [Flavobacterium fryxellicola]SHN50248.1 maltose/moltooligosaccharide transporter [Flavobacterium fryxellicola]